MNTLSNNGKLQPEIESGDSAATDSGIPGSGIFTLWTDINGLPVYHAFNGIVREGGVDSYNDLLEVHWQVALNQVINPEFVGRNLEVIQKGKPEEVVEPVISEGRGFRFLVSRLPLPAGGEYRLLVVIRDITGLTGRRLKPSGSGVLFDLVADNMSDVFCVLNTAGEVSFLSPSIRKLTGYSVEELANLSFSETLSPESVNTVKAVWNDYLAVFKSGKIRKSDIRPVSFEIKFTHKDESTRWAEVVTSLFIDADDNIQGVHGMIRDITEPKKRQEAMSTSLQHERELSQVKSRYISNVSHEFRTPLSIIYSNLQLLEKYRFELDEETIHDAFELSRMAVKSLLRVLDKVTIIDASGKGKLEFKPSECNVRMLCQQVVDEMNEMELVPDRIDLVVDDALDTAWIDENLFRHIFSNILQNALNYSDKKQKVTFSVYPGEQGFINFKVTDKGVGIPPQDLEFIYDPFYRASNSRLAKGSGLGLAVVKECLKLHQGEIFVESDLESGSVFTVVIPLGKSE